MTTMAPGGGGWVEGGREGGRGGGREGGREGGGRLELDCMFDKLVVYCRVNS